MNPNKSHIPIIKLCLQSSPPRLQIAHLCIEFGFFSWREKLATSFQELLTLEKHNLDGLLSFINCFSEPLKKGEKAKKDALIIKKDGQGKHKSWRQKN